MLNNALLPPPTIDDDFYVKCCDLVDAQFGLDIASLTTVFTHEYLVANIQYSYM